MQEANSGVERFVSELIESKLSSDDLSRPLSELPNWDSLRMVKLMLHVEEALGREVEDSEMEALATLEDVMRLVAKG